MLRNLRWLSSTPRFLKSIQEVRTPLRVQSFVTSASKFSDSKSIPAPLVPNGTLPPIPNEHEYTRRTFKSPGQTVQIYKRGHGEHVVFVVPGGVGLMTTHVLPIVAALDMEKYTIYSWDQPGYGESTPPIRDMTNKSLYADADVLRSILKELGHEKYSLLGYSVGAVTALTLAARNPDLVRKVLAWGAFIEMTEEQIAAYRKYGNVDSWSSNAIAQDTKDFLVGVFGYDFFQYHLIQWGELFAEVGEKHGAASYAKQLHAIKTTCPVCFVHGGKDPVIIPKQLELYQKYVKHAEVITIPDAKHTPQYETIGEFLTVVNKFLEKE